MEEENNANVTAAMSADATKIALAVQTANARNKSITIKSPLQRGFLFMLNYGLWNRNPAIKLSC
jgi:hypothetical protein